MSLLTLTGLQDTQITLATDAQAARDLRLNEAKSITRIDDEIDAEAAAAVLKDLASILKATEAARTEIGAPVLELQRKINSTAKDFCAPLETEKTRLSRMLGAWQQAQRDAAEKARIEALENAKRVAAEEAAKIAAAEIEHGEGSAEVAEAQSAAVDHVAAARVAVAQAAPAQPAGTQVRRPWVFEVTDLAALAKAHPELVVITPNKAAINAVIKHNQNIPGLRIWQDCKAVV